MSAVGRCTAPGTRPCAHAVADRESTSVHRRGRGRRGRRRRRPGTPGASRRRRRRRRGHRAGAAGPWPGRYERAGGHDRVVPRSSGPAAGESTVGRPVSAELDDTDWRLLEAPAGDGRASYADLGRLVGLSPSAVTERVRRLEETRVITGYTAQVDPEALGSDDHRAGAPALPARELPALPRPARHHPGDRRGPPRHGATTASCSPCWPGRCGTWRRSPAGSPDWARSPPASSTPPRSPAVRSSRARSARRAAGEPVAPPH
jgi:DNA-binding Lrp family transcriptional regulator